MPLVDFKSMENLLAVALLLVGFTVASGQTKRIAAFEFHVAKSNHRVTIVIRNEPFDPSRHKVGYNKRVGNLVDGRLAYGAESVPRTQIRSIYVYFGRKALKVPRRLYVDCYNPNLESEYTNVRFGRDLETVLVTMWGADGAGAYGVVWILRRSGRHSRYFKPAF